MLRYLNRIGIFTTSKVNPVDTSNSDPQNQMLRPTEIDLIRGEGARTEIGHPKEGRFHAREESAGDFREPKRIRFKVSDPPPPTLTTSARTVKLKSSDGKVFEVDGKTLVESSEKVRSAIESGGWFTGDVIIVPEVDGRALAVAIEYCEKRISGSGDGDLKDWARALFSAEQSTFFDITLAAYHLKMKGLLDLTSQTVTDMIRGKTPLEVKKILNISSA